MRAGTARGGARQSNPAGRQCGPEPPEELVSLYRGSSVLSRIHAASALLMMPQTVTPTFMLVWLINRHHWSLAATGVLVTVSQLIGAVGRILVGRWSDHGGLSAGVGLVRAVPAGRGTVGAIAAATAGAGS
ncbi:hypothetical protein [Mycobacterium sp.]|uniref:hypothetical protein n=1 Tax=Mycobacterium sp. TaxID=1785 RepID=UPI003A89F4A4